MSLMVSFCPPGQMISKLNVLPLLGSAETKHERQLALRTITRACLDHVEKLAFGSFQSDFGANSITVGPGATVLTRSKSF